METNLLLLRATNRCGNHGNSKKLWLLRKITKNYGSTIVKNYGLNVFLDSSDNLSLVIKLTQKSDEHRGINTDK